MKNTIGFSIILLLIGTMLHGVMVDLGPIYITTSADGRVQSSGVLGLEAVDDETSIQTHRSGGNNIRHGIFMFDLQDVPLGWEVGSATLVLTNAGTVSNTGGNPIPISLYAYSGNGLIEEDDFHAPATFSGFLSIPNNSLSAGDSVEIPLSDLSMITEILGDPERHILALRTQTENFATFRVTSLENPNETYLPAQLVLSPIPEPAHLAGLFGILIGLVVLLRRSRRS